MTHDDLRKLATDALELAGKAMEGSGMKILEAKQVMPQGYVEIVEYGDGSVKARIAPNNGAYFELSPAECDKELRLYSVAASLLKSAKDKTECEYLANALISALDENERLRAGLAAEKERCEKYLTIIGQQSEEVDEL